MDDCCRSCGRKYEGGQTPGSGRPPVIFPCLCKVCRGCALESEAKSQQDVDEKDRFIATTVDSTGPPILAKPTPCLDCRKPCNVPVENLLVDAAFLNAQRGASDTATLPCVVCDEEDATKHCDDCKKCKFALQLRIVRRR